MMSPVIKNKLIPCCLIIIAWSGCTYGPNPYGGGYGSSPYGAAPYGGATYPGGYQGGYHGGGQNYQIPTQTLQPGQQYVPNGTVNPGAVYPGGTPTYQPNGGGLVPVPSDGANSNAPPYSSPSAENNKPVPNPSDSNGSPYYNNSSTKTFQPPVNAQEIQPATHEPLPPINNHLRESNASTTIAGPNETYSPPANAFPTAPAPMNNAIDINRPEVPAIPPVNNIPSVGDLAPVNSVDDPFSSPIPAPAGNNSAPQAMPIFDNMSNTRSHKIVAQKPQVFAHDPQYQWLRGVVSKDQPTGTWSVVYSDNPQDNDQYAGHLSLASSPFLKGLKDGAVVELQGEVDPVLKDPLGKPFYLVSRLRTVTGAPAQ